MKIKLIIYLIVFGLIIFIGFKLVNSIFKITLDYKKVESRGIQLVNSFYVDLQNNDTARLKRYFSDSSKNGNNNLDSLVNGIIARTKRKGGLKNVEYIIMESEQENGVDWSKLNSQFRINYNNFRIIYEIRYKDSLAPIAYHFFYLDSLTEGRFNREYLKFDRFEAKVK